MIPLKETMINAPETVTTTVVGATVTATILTNIGLINAVLGGVSIVVGIIACLCLIRIHLVKGTYWQTKLKMLEDGMDVPADTEDEK